MKSIFSGIGILILVIVVVMALSLGGLAWRYYTADIRGTVDAEERIESAQSKIQNYEHYFDLCSTAQTRQQSLMVQEELLSSAEDTKERARIRANVAGLKAQLASAVNQYNVDVQKDYTMARFKDVDLPYELDYNTPINCR